MEDGGRLAPMAAELVDRLAILVVVRRFHGMGVADSRCLRSYSVAISLLELVASTNIFCLVLSLLEDNVMV
jgi:hypothetical protein